MTSHHGDLDGSSRWASALESPFAGLEEVTAAPRLGSDTGGRRLVVAHHPVLSRHRGTPPDLVLTWNTLPAAGGSIDVVVHLHGYSGRGARLRLADKEPISGLDFTDPAQPATVGRTVPTLALLPRGHFFGGRSGAGYGFPMLVQRGALQRLVADGLARLHRHTGVRADLGRLILTAHSGGGAPLNAILHHTDVDEVQLFDGTYGDVSAVAAWASRAIAAGSARAGLRVLYRPRTGTQAQALKLDRALCLALGRRSDAQPLRSRFRVEATQVEHNAIPRVYGWRLLADASADLPGTTSRSCTAVLRDQAEGVPLPEQLDAVQEQLSTEGSTMAMSDWHQELQAGLEASEQQSDLFLGLDPRLGYDYVDPAAEGFVEPADPDVSTLEDSASWAVAGLDEMLDPAEEGFLGEGQDEQGSQGGWQALQEEMWSTEGHPQGAGDGDREGPAALDEGGAVPEEAERWEAERWEAERWEAEPLGQEHADPSWTPETTERWVREEASEHSREWEFDEFLAPPQPGAAPVVTPTPDRQAGRVRRGRFTACSGRAQPGAVALGRQWTRLTGRKAGIYNCRTTVFGTPSLHGEGRAVDAYANARDPQSKAQAETYIAWLIANAIELQVAVVIWNRRIWSWPYRARGWRPYRGNPHTDHVHVELSWEGARHPSSLLTGAVPGMAAAGPTQSRETDSGAVVAGGMTIYDGLANEVPW